MLGGPGAGFLHELGHLMGLRHGGAETSDYDQPNYWSVMNEGYRSFEVRLAGYGVIPVRSGHQLLYTGRDAHGRMRFSNGSMIALDEKALSEEAGYTGGHCVDPPACTDYVNPLSLEGVIPPDLMHDYMVGIEFGSHTLNEFEDVEVGWQDFDLDDQFDSQPYGHNIDYSCRPAENGGWENMRTGATGTESVCWDEFDVNNDIDFLNNGEWADHIKGTKWWCHHNNGTLDAQRNEMGLPDWQEI